jgi:glyoxylate reductase
VCTLINRVDRQLLDAAPNLQFVSSMSVGVDHIDLPLLTERGIPVGHTPGVLVDTTADTAFALLLAAARRVAEADRFVRAGLWRPENPWSPDFFVGKDVSGATLGIIGLGEIGQAVARRAEGFGMRILAWNRSPREVPGVQMVSLEELLLRSDFVSVNVALTAETRNLLDAEHIGMMKPGSVLVNTARGGIVDEAALAGLSTRQPWQRHWTAGRCTPQGSTCSSRSRCPRTTPCWPTSGWCWPRTSAVPPP